MKVSVIIPTYNRVQLVQEAIESVLRQSYRDVEIIVVDDGSTDDTEIMLRRFSSDIRYIKQANQGVNAARNHAVRLAQGEYIALLDNDDLWRDFKLALEVSILDSNPAIGFVFGDFYVLKPDGQLKPNGLHAWFRQTPDWGNLYSSSVEWPLDGIAGSASPGRASVSVHFGDIYYSSLFGPRVLPSASLFRKSRAADWLQFDEQDSQCGDWAFFAQLSHRHGAAFIAMETAFNRSHEDVVRLTRVDRRIQLGKRVEMIERLWRADPSFYTQHSLEVDGELAICWSDQMKQQLFAGDVDGARKAVAELNRLPRMTLSAKIQLYRILSFVPGGSGCLRCLRSVRDRLG
jgi:glycosyltransferase involved in cell wall biosynthesis